MAMDDRKQRVLEAIVTLYTQGGEPVGSGLLCRYFDMAVSSATLRNEMAALTKLGLLEQPHTSAGRVPSAKGYRYYLDNLMSPSRGLTPRQKTEIDRIFAGLDNEPERLAAGAAKALAGYTGYMVAATTPRADDLCIAHFEVVQVGRYAAAVLAVTSAGGVRTRVARLDTGLTRADAALLAQVLNRGLTFVAPADLNGAVLANLAADLGERGSQLYPVLNAAAALLQEAAQARTYLEGEQYLMRWPELIDQLPGVLELFSDEERAGRLITPRTGRTTVLLGEDLQRPMPGLCFMSKRYLAGGGLTGAMALLGPTRMPFEQLMPVLDYFALKLGECMAGKTQEDTQ
ncbi:MAG TPA: heat-inducible transcriptional repressor HrcA [Candidatus Fournierella merdigallinarum]|nr:heat-inducible transcriptional repressor HrcA [Candidatus Fournierella merdigallinarum]